MEEQNVFADCGRLQTEADRIFLPYFEKMEEFLYWLQPLMDGSAGMQANLQRVLQPLYRLKYAKLLQKRWKVLYKMADGRLGADKVAHLLEKRVKDLGDTVQRQVLTGTYSGIVFTLWAAMEKAAWKAEEYLQAGQLLQVRSKDILEKITGVLEQAQATRAEKAGALLADSMTGKAAPEKKKKKIKLDEPGYVTASHLYKELHYLVMANDTVKVPELGKESRKKLEKLGESLHALAEVNELGQTVPAELLKSNTVLSARQGGYLLGDLAAEQLLARKALSRAFEKWIKTVKM
jgi:hypothetical protein